MANKDIRAIYDNGTMIWPATTTTAVVDPASREALDVILGKKEDKPIEITECIPSRLMSINSAEDAVTLSSAEEAQLAPIIAGQNTTTKFTYYSAQAIPLDISGAYAWEILGLRGFTGEVFWILKLRYIDEEINGNTVRSYWVEQEGKTPVFSETDPTNQPVFINIDMADLVANNGIDYPGEVWYFLPEENDPYPESTFIDSEGRNKRVVLRIRPFEDDDYNWEYELENSESWYFPIAIELSPLEGDYYPQDGLLHAAGTAEILRGIQLYNGILYCALVYTWEEDNNHNYYIAIHKTDIKGKISEMPAYEDVPIYPTTGDDINTAFGKINRIVQSHEEVTARALLDLNSRIQNLPGGSGGGIQEITWSALKTLRDGGNLTSGRFYRITDYTCTTTQTDTQSAGHLFDIIVFALSESTLSETAWASHHSEDTYFSNCNLAAWELKYCLDNDTSRFSWADTTNGKGVIYWMKDEWSNECPYDFKNIQTKRWKVVSLSNWQYNGYGITGPTFIYSSTNPFYYGLNSTPYRSTYSEDYDYFYTFNGIEITNYSIAANETEYTYENYDLSLTPKTFGESQEYCVENKIIPGGFRYNGLLYIPLVVFYGVPNCITDSENGYYLTDPVSNIYGNIVDQGCYNLTFGSNAIGNYIHEYTNNVLFGKNCILNEVGQWCWCIVLGNKCERNIIGDSGSYINISGQGTDDNNETYVNQCVDNYIENSGMEIYLSGSNNTIHSNCQKLIMYGESLGNTIESNFNVGTIYNSSHCYIGESCDHISFGKASTITIKNNCSNINFQRAYIFNIEIGACNQNISITTSQTPTSSNLLQNLIVRPGVNMSSTMKTISHDTLGDTTLTTYKPANSVEISV